MKQQLATICYLDNGQEFLLLYRNKKPNDVHEGKWIGVGGKVEAGESPEECAKREVFEETGYVVEAMDLVGLITFPAFTPGTDWYTYVYRVHDFTGEQIESPEGTLAWVPYDQVLAKPSWEGDHLFLQWILDQKPLFSAKMAYEGQELTDWSVHFYQ
ncbi:NUDIX hydrolase [Streptococcus danieliae]|uniref:NUDIX hydrolase n=1 Tax=Streptococcus danieliae TaxID=747656 RepID=UPI0017BD1D98|nr:8-oxo-dGTP diphosphatase [Streptococcus danieliae]MCU0082918.1 8-oxo-dGTP diphosphatase [Streptococcus danieliae]NYS32975.1 8-oxo-dGTP diphosphatase [Streptococcus danieliae]